jgi:hypothetical protein
MSTGDDCSLLDLDPASKSSGVAAAIFHRIFHNKPLHPQCLPDMQYRAKSMMFKVAPRFNRDTWALIERKVPQSARRRLREFRIEQQLSIDDLRMKHAPVGLNLGEMPSIRKRQPQP